MGDEQAHQVGAQLGAAVPRAGVAQAVAAQRARFESRGSAGQWRQDTEVESTTARLSAVRLTEQSKRPAQCVAETGLGTGVATPMFHPTRILSSVVNTQPVPPQQSALLRDAIRAHETKLIESSEGRALVLPALVQQILGRPVDRLTFIPRCHEPVAVVDGLLFRGEASNPYDLRDGWLCVRTEHNGWRQVNSLEHLGEIARREPLALVDAS